MTVFDQAWLIVKQDVMRLEDYPLTGLEGGLPPSNLRGEELFVTAGKKPGSKSSLPFSFTEKMPSPSFGIPTKYCKSGHIMADVPGAICGDCYAQSGTYNFPSTRDANERRYQKLMENPVEWGKSMARLIPLYSQMTKDELMGLVPISSVNPDYPSIDDKEGYFRWHDSGDIQSPQHLSLLMDIARATPSVNHWLPIHEPQMLRQFLNAGCDIPENMLVIVSSPMKFQRLSDKFDHPRVKYSSAGRKQLFGELGENEQQCPGLCLDENCNTCWTPDVENVDYQLKRGGQKVKPESALNEVMGNPTLMNQLMSTEEGFNLLTSTEEGKMALDHLLNRR